MAYIVPDEYRGYAVLPDGVAEAATLELRVDPAQNGGADVLCIYTGTATFQFQGTSGDWRRGTVEIAIPTGSRIWSKYATSGKTTWLSRAAVIAAPASLLNKGPANRAGWAIDAAVVEIASRALGVHPTGEDYIRLLLLCAVSDSDGYLSRASYQVTVMGNEVA